MKSEILRDVNSYQIEYSLKFVVYFRAVYFITISGLHEAHSKTK